MPAKSLVAEILRYEAEIPDKPAFIFLGNKGRRTVLSYSEVSCLSQKFAARLRALGVTRGDVVCNILPTSPERLITHLGTIMAGAVSMNGQICRSDGSDFVTSLNDGQAKAIIYDPNNTSGAYETLKQRANHCGQTENRFAGLETPWLQKMIPCVLKSHKTTGKCLMEELEDAPDKLCEDNGPDSVCVLVCTSGSTGRFKLFPYTSQYIMDGSLEVCRAGDIHRMSVLFNDKPLGWIGGLPSFELAVGCTRVTVDETVPRGKDYLRYVAEALRQEKCTAMITIPSFLESLVKESTTDNHKDAYLMRSVLIFGAPVAQKVQKCIGTVTKSLTIIYGSTETYALSAITLTSSHGEYTDFLCGRPLEGSELRIVDSNMEDVPAGCIGDILLRKPGPCLRYINNDKANKQTFLPGGWISLGDRGFLDEAGQIFVLGRGSQAINRGDDIIYPGQLEAPLLQCPGLAEVLVVGVPDEALMEEVCGLLVRSPEAGDEINEEYVRRFCRENLFVIPENAEFDPMPKYFRFVDAIPKLKTGKADVAAARQLAIRLINNPEGR
ncbi:acetyl-coenzyme A synthetase [Elysia marginata]|uniref:Acetyl-coenzyme A synthetase n=1 Tax=Elysia marginata TaxID=1093978 RepID=A0AAV4EZT3_9GAST|nr:acetyl-coenzyme A synthetase [Elysia marginata]